VLRAIFRICFEKFYHISSQEKRMTQATLDGAGPQCRKVVWGRKDEEYVADFLALTKRSLNEEEYRIFRMHYLLGANWRMCCQRLSVDKGQFFHIVYRIEQKVGRVFKETQPYALYPVDEYYSGAKVEHKAILRPMDRREPLQVPVVRGTGREPGKDVPKAA
jgi:hypothetical protein